MSALPQQFPVTAVREIKLLQKLDHQNVIRLRDVLSDPVSSSAFKKQLYHLPTSRLLSLLPFLRSRVVPPSTYSPQLTNQPKLLSDLSFHRFSLSLSLSRPLSLGPTQTRACRGGSVRCTSCLT